MNRENGRSKEEDKLEDENDDYNTKCGLGRH